MPPTLRTAPSPGRRPRRRRLRRPSTRSATITWKVGLWCTAQACAYVRPFSKLGDAVAVRLAHSVRSNGLSGNQPCPVTSDNALFRTTFRVRKLRSPRSVNAVVARLAHSVRSDEVVRKSALSGHTGQPAFSGQLFACECSLSTLGKCGPVLLARSVSPDEVVRKSALSGHTGQPAFSGQLFACESSQNPIVRMVISAVSDGRLDNGSTTARQRLDNGSTTARWWRASSRPSALVVG